MKKFICISIIVLFTTVTNAQWQPDVRLTNDPAISIASNNNAWCVASYGNSVHVVWYDARDGNNEIYYKRSTDEGSSWGSDTRLTNNTASSIFPSVSVSGSVVHVVWVDFRDGNEIYYKRSSDGGVSWEADKRLTNNSTSSYTPCVSSSGSYVHVVWDEYVDGNDEIYYKRSIDGGVSWDSTARLTNNFGNSELPSVTVSGLAVHVVWKDPRDGNNEIYYKRSQDGGSNWGADTRLTNNTAISWYPSIAVSGSVVHVLWKEDRDGNNEVYYKRSTDGGGSWGSDTRLTNNSANSSFPSVSASGSFVHVVWEDNRDGNFEIYYKRTTDGGTSWGSDTRLTNNSASSSNSSVSTSGSTVHVVWNDSRDGNTEIYYKRDPTGNIVGIKNTNSEIPKEFCLSQNYPNPFNPTTKIQFTIQHTSFSFGEVMWVRLIVYNILGREVSTLVNEQLKPGTYEVEFDGSKFVSGVYYYSLITDEFKQTKKMILLK